MLVLAIDTAGHTGGVLLARNDDPRLMPDQTEVLGVHALEPRKFSIQLISAIAEVLVLNQVVLADIDAIAVVSGPGSFTGLRVGLSAVKALSEGAARPIIALSRLGIMASMVESFGFQLSAEQGIHALLDAGRGEYYHGIYRDSGRTCVSESLDTVENLVESFAGLPGIVLASEANVVSALGEADVPICEIPPVSVREMLPLVFDAWQARRFVDVACLDANYVRKINFAMPRSGPAPGPVASRAGEL